MRRLTDREKEFGKWYTSKIETYKILAERILSMLNDELPNEIICNKTCRAKTMESAKKKYNTMIRDDSGVLCFKYSDFKTEITDYAGVRVITYLTSNLEVIDKYIRKLFVIDEPNTVDKQNELSSNEVGYIAKHYIVSLKKEDCSRPANSKFKNLKCEIQVKTVLQDAWAQIFHDRQYKPDQDIDESIQRRTNLLAGSLELIDNDISDLVSIYDKCASKYQDEVYLWELMQRNIDEDSLAQYAKIKLKMPALIFVKPKMIIDLLNKMEIDNLLDINNEYSERIIEDISISFKSYLFTIDKFYVFFCLIYKPEKFFEITKSKEISRKSYGFLSKHIADIDKLIERYHVEIK